MTTPVQDTSILDIPGAKDAINFITQQVAAFQRVPSRIANVIGTMTNAKRLAETKGLNDAATRAAMVIDQAQNLQGDFGGTSSAVANLLDELRTSGMLSGTLDTIYNAIGTAASMAQVLNGVDNLEQLSSQVVDTTMTAQEKAKYASAGAGSSSLIKYLLLGGAAYAVIWALRRGGGTRRF